MQKQASLFTPVLITGCVIILVSFAIRASFGVFQIPIAQEFNWPRAEFSPPSRCKTSHGASDSLSLARLPKK